MPEARQPDAPERHLPEAEQPDTPERQPAAASKRRAPRPLTDPHVSSFDTPAFPVPSGGGWDRVASGPGAKVELRWREEGFHSRGALHLSGSVPAGTGFAMVGAALQLGAEAEPFDVSHYDGVRLALRGNGAWLQVMLVRGDVEDLNYPVVSVQATEEWRYLHLLFSDFEQPPFFGTSRRWTGKDLVGLALTTEVGFFGQVELDVDSVEFFEVEKKR